MHLTNIYLPESFCLLIVHQLRPSLVNFSSQNVQKALLVFQQQHHQHQQQQQALQLQLTN